MKINTLKLSFLILFLLSLNSFAQKSKTATSLFGRKVSASTERTPDGHIRCASTEYEAALQEQDPKRPTKEQFESWISQKIAEGAVKKGTNGTTVVITIPVVVHVISDGDVIGSNENIANAQVLSQITVLNQDYRRMLNTPGYNTNAVGADVEVEFCLAQRDPYGEATTGIDRVNLGQADWDSYEVENVLKPKTIWDPSKYLNLWVCRFGRDLDGILGYAQFPNNSNLGGLSANNGPANTDGVIIGYQYFGSRTLYAAGTYENPYDKGRTATHEIGHFLGLRHIWGDNSSCTVNATDSSKDFCPDTPAANDANYGCNLNANSCPLAAGNDMVQNYMDYSNDACMNIFTLNQKARILAVLQNATRRASLLTSNACTPADSYGLDAGLKINLNIGCNTTFTPSVTLKNNGTSVLTSAAFTYSLDNTNVQTYNWTGSLAVGASTEVILNTFSTTAGSHTLGTALLTANGVVDNNISNNIKSEAFDVTNSFATTNVTFTLQRDFYGSETVWFIRNSGGTVLYSGGPYEDSETNTLPDLITQTFAVGADQCYNFLIYDLYEDGICCSPSSGSGYFNFKTADNTVILSSPEFGYRYSANFAVNQTVLGNENFDFLNTITLYPNPAKNVVNISLQGDTALPDSFVVFNTLGQVIQSTKVNSVSNLSINTSVLSNGIYFIKIDKDNESKTLRFIKN